jgi:hypothetical protein
MHQTTTDQSGQKQQARPKSETWIRHALDEFADYGLAVRKDTTLSLNQHGLNTGRSKNNFVPLVDGLERALERLLVPRVLLLAKGTKKGGPIVTEWAQLESMDGASLESRRAGGLTPMGEALTDYVVWKRAVDLLYGQLLENRPLLPEQPVRPGFERAVRIGGDTPSARRELSEAAADYLAIHAAEFAVVAAGLKDYPGKPRLILASHAEAMADVPVTEERMAAYQETSDLDPSTSANGRPRSPRMMTPT